MPVIANQKKPDHLYCPPDALHPASLHHGLPYHPAQLNGNTLRRTLEEFRAHHQACAARRRNALEYELRVEEQRTEWLTRKFMDGVRQQQQQSGGSGSTGAAQGKSEQQQQRSGSSEGNSNGAAANAGTGTSSTTEDTVKVKQQPPASPDGLIAALTGQKMDVKKSQVSNGNSSNLSGNNKHSGLSTTPTTGGGGSGRSGGGGGSGSHLGECPEGGASNSSAPSLGPLQRQSSNGRSSKQSHSNNMALNLSLSNGTTGGSSSSNKATKSCLSNGVDTTKVLIKKEPDSFESGNQNHHCNRSPTTTSSVSGRRLSLNGKDNKRSQRTSISQKPNNDKLMRSFSMSDDLEDDLKLSAADCMGGVISTPPIKPLEEGDDMITTPSPPTSAGLLGSSKLGGSSRSGSAVENTNTSGASTTNHVTASTTTASQVTSPNNSMSQAEMNKKVGLMPSNANVKDNASLLQELDDFSKIMDEVAMEQRANEERLVLNQPADVFHRPPPHAHGAQSHDMVATPHVPRPTHLISPPPYYAATATKPAPSQQYYNHPAAPGRPPSYATTPHGASSVQDPSLYIGVDYQQSLSQQHMTPTQVDPATFAPRSDQMHSQQRHPQLQHISASAVSPQVHQQPPSLGGGQSRSVLVSPTVQGMPLPHTPISSHLPPFPDPAVSSVTTPTMPPPHTPTTPLEHFSSTFPGAPPHQQQQPPHPTPPSQLHSPTHPQYVTAAPPPPQAGTVPMSSTAFPFGSHLRSPTVTSAGFNWQPNAGLNSSLRDKMLAQVNSHIEARIGGQKRLSQEAGFSIPPPTKMVATAAGPSPYPPQISHMTLRPQTPAQQQQYLPSGAPPTAPPTGSIAAAGYTGLSQQQQQLVHTISYQGQGRMTSAPGYPHHHI